MTRTIIDTGRLIAVPDIRMEERVSGVMENKGIRSLIGLPLKVQEQVIGVLYLNSVQSRQFSTEDQSLLLALANQAALAVQNARLLADAERCARDLRPFGLTGHIRTTLGLQDLLTEFASQVTDVLHGTCVIYLAETKEGQSVLQRQSTGNVIPDESIPYRFSASDGTAGGSQSGVSQGWAGVSIDPSFAVAVKDFGKRGFMGIPVKVEGQTVGVIKAERDENGGFSDTDRLFLESVANVVGIVIQRANVLDSLRDMVYLPVWAGSSP